MRLVFVSDTHNQMHKIELPLGDVLVHSGDALGRGDLMELSKFNHHLKDIGFEHVLFTPGNHDWPFQEDFSLAKKCLPNATILLDESKVIDGIHFYGSPWQPWFHSWAFNLHRGEEIAAKWAMIPEDVDVLFTHGPPMHIQDETLLGEHVGCEDLYKRVMDLKPKIHAFGHIHPSYGAKETPDTLFINASTCNEAYMPVHEPIVVDIDEDKKVTLITDLEEYL